MTFTNIQQREVLLIARATVSKKTRLYHQSQADEDEARRDVPAAIAEAPLFHQSRAHVPQPWHPPQQVRRQP